MNRSSLFLMILLCSLSLSFAAKVLEPQMFEPQELPLAKRKLTNISKKTAPSESYYETLVKWLHGKTVEDQMEVFWGEYERISDSSNIHTLFKSLRTEKWSYYIDNSDRKRFQIPLYKERKLLKEFKKECLAKVKTENNIYKRAYLIKQCSQNSRSNSWFLDSDNATYLPGDPIRIKKADFTQLNLYRMKLNTNNLFQEFTLIDEIKLPEKSDTFNLSDSAEAGIYRGTFYSNDAVQDVYFLVSAIYATYKRDRDKIVLHAGSKSPAIKPPFTVHILTSDSTVQPLKTDSNGLLTITCPPTKSVSLLIEQNSNYCLLSETRSRFSAPQDSSLLIYSYSDRPVYRPKQTVQMKSIMVLQCEGGSFVAPKLDSVEINITTPGREKPIKKTVAVDSFGHMSDSFYLDETAALGKYLFWIEKTYPPLTISSNTKNKALFSVQEYKKSEFEISTSFEDSVLYTNDTAILTISGAYFTGKPLSDASVKIRWYQSYYDPTYYYYSNNEELLSETNHSLNSQGELQVPFTDKRLKVKQFLSAEVIITDKSRREIRDTISIQVQKHKNFLFLENQNEWTSIKSNTPCNFPLWLKDKRGKGYRREINVVISPVNKSKKSILDTTITSDETGNAHFTYSFPEKGTYTLKAWTTIGDSTHFLEYDKINVNNAYSWVPLLSISADKKEYQYGDTALVTVINTSDSKEIFTTLELDTILSCSIDSTLNDTLLYQVPIVQEYGTGLIVSTTISGKEEYNATKRLFLPIIDSTRLLQVSLKGESELQPGAEFKGKIHVTDTGSNPIVANFSVALVDEAIFHLPEGDGTGNTEDLYTLLYDLESLTKNNTEGILSIFPEKSTNEVKTVKTGYWGHHDLKELGLPSIPNYGGRVYTFDAATVQGYMDNPTPLYITDADRSENEMVYYDEMSISNLPKPRVRSNFKDLGYWNGSVTTNKRGKAKLNFTMPDDLTTWRLTLIGSDGKAQFIDFRDTLKTDLPVMVRLQAPRTLVEGDSLLLTSVVQNYKADTMTYTVTMSLDSSSCEAKLLSPKSQRVILAPGESKQVNWPCSVAAAGELHSETAVLHKKGSDAEKRSYPVKSRAIQKNISLNGRLKNSDSIVITPDLPEDVLKGSEQLSLTLSPSIAFTLFESLDYLTGYPYGCVEQTMSRFLPNLYVKSTLEKMNIEDSILAGTIDKYTHIGVKRLQEFQNRDGGWGWWKSASDPRMTALVYNGLHYAASCAIGDSTKAILTTMLKKAKPRVHKLISSRKPTFPQKIDLLYGVISFTEDGQYDTLLTELSQKCEKLPTKSLSQLIEMLHRRELKTSQEVVMKELLSRAQEHPKGIYWGGSETYRWYAAREEATASVVKALSIAAPTSPELEQAVMWLLTQKKKRYWVSTKTTASVIDALATFITATNAQQTESTITIYAGDTLLDSLTLDKKSTSPKRFNLPQGSKTVGITQQGAGTLYYTVHTNYTSTEDFAKANSNGIKLKRSYKKLAYTKNRRDEWDVKRVPFDGVCKSGDEIEVTITMECDGSYEHVMVEDFFPSGMEVLNKSQDWYSRWCGWWWRGYDNREARDDRMVFFMSWAPSGKTTMTYLLRAETPGRFTALPTKAECMYEPEISGNSEAMSVLIEN